ncbi:MAG: helix-turn-helix domain-containing protein [Candidatus Comchoanobacterales bacterium]
MPKQGQCENLSSAEHRASRLKTLREMTGLSREAVKKKYGIARGTLQNWETARFGGLTVKGAHLVVKAFKAENIQCSPEWLLHGIGTAPSFNQKAPVKSIPNNIKTLTHELLYFRHQNSDTIDFTISDDSMLPYTRGTVIIGRQLYQENIEKALWQDCIINTIEHGILFRLLRPGNQIGVYNLYARNIHSHAPKLMLHNVEILSAAPICWLRHPDFNSPLSYTKSPSKDLVT